MNKITKQYFETSTDWIPDEYFPDKEGYWRTNDKELRKWDINWNKTIRVKVNPDEGGFRFSVTDENDRIVVAFDADDFRHVNTILSLYDLHIGGYGDEESKVYGACADWDVGSHIAEYAHYLIQQYHHNTMCYPGIEDMTYRKWCKTIGHILFALYFVSDDLRMERAYDWYMERYKDDPSKYQAFLNRIDRGLTLFGRYFNDLNW